MIVFDAPVTPADLTVFVRHVPLPSNLILSALFPEVVRPETTVNFTEISKTNRTARFRSFDGRIHVADRDGGADKLVKLPALSDSRNAGEYERLQLAMAQFGGTRTEALAQAVYNDAQDLTSYVRNRMELAIADLLVDGVLTVSENGFNAVYDYGVAGGNKPTAGTVWSTHATAPALTDLITWADAYEAVNGERPSKAIASRSVLRHLQQNTELINAVKGAQTGVTRVSLEDARNVFENEGLPTEWIVDETNLDVDGSTTRVWPVDKIAFLPANPGDVLEVRYGLSATALELVNSNEVDMSFEDAPGIVGVVEKQGPPYREFTYVDALGMPIVKDAKKVFTADVL